MSELFDRLSNLSPKRLALFALELQEQLDAAERVRAEPIAIVGMGCRLPGADGPDAYWRLLIDGVDAITEIPYSRWDADEYYDPDPDIPGKIATRWGGFLPDIDRFEPQFFGISPREARSLDPQQRLLLEVAWEALEHAGIAPDSLHGSSTGVYVGMCNGDYGQLLLDGDGDDFDMYLSTGNAGSVASGRLSYVLGLQGPALTVDTACSSSLVAVHLAVQALRTGACRMALAGGVNVILSPKTSMTLSRAKMMAADGRCKAFDARADGFVRGEGCGLVVLKRLSDAIADGDTVLATIRGSAVNQDGRSNGLTAPNGPSQVAVIRAALADAGVEPADVSFVETHGTGTSLGDPIEAQALGAALGSGRSVDHRLMIGSAKTNLGHLESAAGIAGVLKVVLSLRHGEIPPLLHLTEPNPYIPWDQLAIDVPTTRTPWSPVNGRRIAGVSSFGFSGTNAHLVLEAAPPIEPAPLGIERPLHVLTLSARTEAALVDLVGRFAEHLVSETAAKSSIADVAFTANTGRSHLPHRLAIVAADSATAVEALVSFAAGEHAENLVAGVAPSQRAPQVAFLFTGHGSQYAGMGQSLFETQPVFREVIDRCAEILAPLMDRSLLDVLFATDSESGGHLLDNMAYAQPALFAIEYALARLWQSWGVHPSAVAGHSVGEYVAAVVAGAMSLEDGLKLVAARGRLMASLPADGEMATVWATEARVEAALASAGGRVSVAAINGPQSIALSATGGALQAVLDDLRADGIEIRPLAIPIAAHSAQVEPILDEFELVASTVRYAQPHVDVVSGMTGRLATGDDLVTARYWRQHLRQPVRFADALQSIYDSGTRIFIEIGPHPTLLGMGRHVVPEHECTWLPSLRSGHDDWTQMSGTLAQLSTGGVDVDWVGFDGPFTRRKVDLPTYPFQRERFWADTRSRRRPSGAGEHPLLGHRVLSPALGSTARTPVVFESELGATWPSFLDHHRVYGAALLPSPAYLEMALAAAQQALGGGPYAVDDFAIREALILPDDDERPVQIVLHPRDDDTGAGFEVFSRDPAGTEFTLHATGRVASASASPSPSAANGTFDPDDVRSRCATHIDGDSYYARLAELGLEFGSGFRGLTDVWRRDGEALGRVVLPPTLMGEAASYSIHPAMLDACFHLLGAPMLALEGGNAYLLIGIDHFRLVASPGHSVWNHTVLRPGFDNAEGTFAGDIRLYDDDGRLVAEALGLHLRYATRDALLRASQQWASEWLYEVQWVPKERESVTNRAQTSAPATTPSAAEIDAGTDTWVVLADAGGVGEQLVALLDERGARTVIVAADVAVDRDAVARAVGELPPGRHRVIDLRALGLPSIDSLTADDLESVDERAVGSVLEVTQALVRAARPASLWIVTRSAQPAGDTIVSPEQAPMWGFGRVIALEHPELWGGLIDLGPGATPASDASSLVDEICDNDGEDQVALRSGARFVPRLVRSGPRPSAPMPWHRDASYLVTGGLGGLGLKTARWMAEQGAGCIVLIGRHGVPPRDQWDALDPGSRVAGQVDAIRSIELSGARIEVVAADVADEGDMTALFVRFGHDLPPLRGVVHLAAALGNWSIDAMPSDALAAMLRPKIAGTRLLHQLTRELSLDCFVLFSSTTALWGSRDLAHYAAANHFLDAFAHHRRAHGLPALSVNWGTWDEMRTASAEDRELVASAGLNPMPSEHALRMLGNLLGRRDTVQMTVASVDWHLLKAIYEARRARPFLSLVTSRQVATLMQRAHVEPVLAEQLAGAPPEQHHELVVTFLRDEVARALGIQPAASIDIDQGLFDMGMDSLMSVELKGRIETAIGADLPSTLTFNYPNINALADFLTSDAVLGTVGVGDDDPQSARRSSDPLTTVSPVGDDLSEDDLAAMLAARLGALGRERS